MAKSVRKLDQCGIRIGRTRIAFKTANDAIFSLENIITVYLAARLALANELTVGISSPLWRLSTSSPTRR